MLTFGHCGDLLMVRVDRANRQNKNYQGIGFLKVSKVIVLGYVSF